MIHDPISGIDQLRKEKAKHLVRSVSGSDNTKPRIVIPTLVLAEVLTNTSAEQKNILTHLQASIIFVPFCATSAKLCARIMPHFLSNRVNYSYPRPILKVDAMILATAEVNKVGIIYNSDNDFKAMVESLDIPLNVRIKNIDSYEYQPEIPELAE